MIDLHRHDEFSFFDGSGKAEELAKIAKDKGLTSLGLTNHGNTSGNILHYFACKNVGLKPIMGCEGYFLPVYKEQTRGFHLILIAKSVEGYKNLNIIQTLGDEQKYYNPIWTFDILEKYNEGLICCSACVASFSSQMILKGKIDLAIKYLKKMQKIFKDDFYIEIQPYSISEKGVQEKVNLKLIELAKQLKIKMVLTSDSHRGYEEDLDAYVMMHKLKNNDEEFLQHIKETYKERYMPSKNEMFDRFVKMHKKDLSEKESIKLAKNMYDNLESLEEKVDADILDKIAKISPLPIFDKNYESNELLTKKALDGLKQKQIKDSKYIVRCKEEIETIKKNNFADYFLIVADYVNWAKNNGVLVGPGRGSGCNCLINYVLNITDVDSIKFDLDYQRFMREGKTSIPDIDVDFETNSREKVIKYLLKKYKKHSCRVAAYGMFKIDNLINDLFKVYDNAEKEDIAIIKNEIKNCVSDFDGLIDFEKLDKNITLKNIEKKYNCFLKTFKFLYNKIKYLGTHAAGVIITNQEIFYYTALRVDKKTQTLYSVHNLLDLEKIGAIKFDLLGLNTLSTIYQIQKHVKSKKNIYDIIEDKNVLKAFNEGKTNGIFQFDSDSSQIILKKIDANCFNDVVATTAMNRPGPLRLKMPDKYAYNKLSRDFAKENVPYKNVLKETNGCILYQEQVIKIATDYAGMKYDDADKIRKMDDPSNPMCRQLIQENYDKFLQIFVKGMQKYKMSEEKSKQLFDDFLNYTFNKGHAVGYTLLSFQEMFYKVYYPAEYWFAKLNQYNFEKDGQRLLSEAVSEGLLAFLPHINYSSGFSLRKIDGEKVIQIGLSTIKSVGAKAAKFIEDERKKNGIYLSYDDFIFRCKVKGSPVNKRVIEALIEDGALEFNKNVYIKKVKKYNSVLYQRAK